MDLSGNYITLRPIAKAEPETLARLLNNRKIWDQLRDYLPHPYGLEDARAHQARCAEESPTHTFGIFRGSELVGVIGMVPQTDVHRHTAEVGYWVGEPYWGQGLATDAIRTMAKYAFEALTFRRLQAGVFATNPASARVLEKAGFRLEGTAVDGAYKNGQFVDLLNYALLNPTPDYASVIK